MTVIDGGLGMVIGYGYNLLVVLFFIREFLHPFFVCYLLSVVF
jgi:hypothetical protein